MKRAEMLKQAMNDQKEADKKAAAPVGAGGGGGLYFRIVEVVSRSNPFT